MSNQMDFCMKHRTASAYAIFFLSIFLVIHIKPFYRVLLYFLFERDPDDELRGQLLWAVITPCTRGHSNPSIRISTWTPACLPSLVCPSPIFAPTLLLRLLRETVCLARS